MYAEISIHYTTRLNFQHLFAGMPGGTTPLSAMEQTVFRTTPELGADAVYARVMPSIVYIIFALSADTLRIHVENKDDSGSIAKLKSSAEEVARTLSDAGKRAHFKCDTPVIRIHAEKNLIQEGQKVRILQFLFRRFRETIIGDILVSGIAAFTGLIFNVEAKTSLYSGIAVFIALIIWIVIEAASGSMRYEYDDV